MRRYTLYTNNPYDIDFDDYANDLREQGIIDPDTDDYDAMNYALECLGEDYEVLMVDCADLRTDGEIICIGDLGLWNGRVSGYKELSTCNVSDCFRIGDDYITIYVDRYNDLRADGVHHDGTNHYLFRSLKPDLSYVQEENFLNKLYTGAATRRDIARYTDNIGSLINTVYGWR